MPVELSDIQDARKILQGIINPTPIVADELLSKEIQAKVFLKAECLQKGGSFKVRGAYNKISRLTPEEKKRGVVAPSAGNHAQGVALAAQLHRVKSTIVMPKFAPLTKINATRGFGAQVILHGESFDEAAAHARELQKKRGLIYVHAFDDDLIIAGQGTIGMEIVEDRPQTNVIVVPIGGGGIISGIAIAAKALLSDVRIIGVEADHCASMKASLDEGKLVEAQFKPTIADGIAIKQPAERTLRIIRKKVDQVVTVTEDEIARGIYHCVQNNHLVVEGAGAAGVGALLAGKIKVSPNDNVCAVLCGGNIDANLLARILEQVLVRQGRYVLLKILVGDRPGALASLTEQVALAGGNVIEVFHRRAMWLAPLGRVGIELLLEVRDREHAEEVIRKLEKKGYNVELEGVGDWEE
ncbi:MAG: threonine ammonia-lyase [Pyrinomonadaceae bacterium]